LLGRAHVQYEPTSWTKDIASLPLHLSDKRQRWLAKLGTAGTRARRGRRGQWRERHGHGALMNSQNRNVLEVRGRLRRRTGTRWGRHGHGALMNSHNMNVLEVRGRPRRRTGTRWGRRRGRHGHGALMTPQNMNVLEVRGRLRRRTETRWGRRRAGCRGRPGGVGDRLPGARRRDRPVVGSETEPARKSRRGRPDAERAGGARP
jgi:hypothetical protein